METGHPSTRVVETGLKEDDCRWSSCTVYEELSIQIKYGTDQTNKTIKIKLKIQPKATHIKTETWVLCNK